jgi:tetratricopeptide (TPR) repeat protein
VIRKRYPGILLALVLLLPGSLLGQVILGRITGQVRTPRGDYPARQILVELRLHGGTVESVYTDNQGRFGFSNLEANGYRIVINDEEYYPVDERADVNPDVMSYTRVQIALRAREEKQKNDPAGARASGGNPYLVDPGDYNKRFPKKALKEYERGVGAERKGNHDEAIAHYQSALKIAPEYYPAHNNLGSIYLSKADFTSAEEQFQEAVRLDRNDAQAYFNLGNLFLLKGRYSESEAAVASGLQRQPDSAFGHFLQGSLYGRNGKLPEAEKSLRAALQMDSTMWQAHLQLVSLYLQQQRRQPAIAELQFFLKAFPSVSAAPKAKELLQKLQGENDSAHLPE